MFREMRRIKQELPLEEAKSLLMKNKRGVLSFNREDGYPYSIPINFLYDEEENKIYFHGPRAFRKWLVLLSKEPSGLWRNRNHRGQRLSRQKIN